MIKEPKIYIYYIINVDKVPHLLALSVAPVSGEELNASLLFELIVLVKCDAGHSPFVLLSWSIDVEVPKAYYLLC